MALRASARLLPRIARQRTAVRWTGPTAGQATVNWAGACGDYRIRYELRSLSVQHIAQYPMHLTPPQPAPLWNHSAEDILKLTKEAIEYDRVVQDKVGSLSPKDCSFDSVSCNAV